MFIGELTIAKSEHMAFNEKFSHLPNMGGMKIAVPNAIDRLLRAIASLLNIK